MLDERGIEYRYREYTKNPLDEGELKALLEKLEARPADVLRLKDRANRELGLKGDESDKELIAAMLRHPTLLARPIGVVGDRAIVGRPPERLLDLADQ